MSAFDAAVVAAANRLVDAQNTGHCLYARDHGGHRRGRVRDLCIDVIGLGEGDMRKGLEGELILLTGLAPALPFENASRRHGRDPHSVADEQNHVLRRTVFRDIASGGGDLRAARLEPCVLFSGIRTGGLSGARREWIGASREEHAEGEDGGYGRERRRFEHGIGSPFRRRARPSA